MILLEKNIRSANNVAQFHGYRIFKKKTIYLPRLRNE